MFLSLWINGCRRLSPLPRVAELRYHPASQSLFLPLLQVLPLSSNRDLGEGPQLLPADLRLCTVLRLAAGLEPSTGPA